ncbi:MAG: sugar ABC transporter permease [bacterium]|nr:sugar ABC transporter permease [bacterium]
MPKLSLAKREAIACYLFISPCILGLLIFTLGPMFASFFIAFTDWDIMTHPVWIGLANYKEIFTDDPLFWKSLGNTVYYTAFAVPLGLVGSFLLALLLNTKVKGLSFFRTAFYLPAIVPAVASSMLWLWILQPEFGLLNAFLRMLHLPAPPWMADPSWAKPAIILTMLWGLGNGMIIYLAGLQGIPEQLYEAASIDGANGWYQFWHITIPQMSPVIFFNLIMGMIGALQVFTQAFVMSNGLGGPADSTLFYVFYIFNKGFREFQMGYACALAWILFVIVLLITLIQFKFVGKRVYYEFGATE